MAAKAKPNEIYLERIYDAPVKLVWDAYTDPKHAAKWWGPRGFTITTHSKDLRPGGTWNYVMHGPDGVDWPNIATYHEVEKYSRLVYDHGATETTPPLFRVTVNFIDLKGKKTKMEMTMAFENVERAKEIGKFIKQAGGNSTWDRLGEYLEKEQNGNDKFIINRSFNAPIEVMYDMFTNPEHIAKWLAPTGMDMTYLKSDIKTGGSAHFRMSDGKGFSLHNNVKYLELRSPDLVLYTQQFSDEKENPVRAPFNEKWSMTMQTRIELTKEDENTTRVTVTWEIVGEVTPAELEVFINERPGMTVGWTGSFDKLEEYVASR